MDYKRTKERNFNNTLLPGIPMLIGGLLLLCATIYFMIIIITGIIGSDSPLAMKVVFIVLSSILFIIINCIFWIGFMLIEPNEARVMIFFGKYRGTVKRNGYFWVNPFYSKEMLTLRARNLDAEPIKVNDKNGNPILIGQVIVWKVVDTYKASFEVDNTSKSSQTIEGTDVAASVNDKMRAYEAFCARARLCRVAFCGRSVRIRQFAQRRRKNDSSRRRRTHQRNTCNQTQ